MKIYYLVYVEDCIQKIKGFKTLKARDTFIDKFTKTIANEDDWLDFMFSSTDKVIHFEVTE